VCASTETSESCPADCKLTLTCGASSCTVQACNWHGNTTVHNGDDIETSIAICAGKLPTWFKEMDCFVNDSTYNAMKNFTGSPKLCSPGYAYCLCVQGSMQWAVQIMPTANFEQSVDSSLVWFSGLPGASGTGGQAAQGVPAERRGARQGAWSRSVLWRSDVRGDCVAPRAARNLRARDSRLAGVFSATT